MLPFFFGNTCLFKISDFAFTFTQDWDNEYKSYFPGKIIKLQAFLLSTMALGFARKLKVEGEKMN